MTAPAVTYFQVLYTANLTQKRKKWFDGQCVFSTSQHKVKLLDEDGRFLAEDRWNADLPEVGSQHMCERFLVEIDSLVKQTAAKPAVAPALPATRASSMPKVDRLTLPDMGPSLADVLPVVGRLTPVNTTDLALSRIAEPLVTKRRKYAPWGDVHALLPSVTPYEPETHSFDYKSSAERGSDALNSSEEDHAPKYEPLDEAPNETIDFTELSQPLALTPSVDIAFDEPLFVEDDDSDLVAPATYELDSDLESDVEITELKPASHKSLFADLPSRIPQEGPWTKEAYLLFSWHPPVVKPEVE